MEERVKTFGTRAIRPAMFLVLISLLAGCGTVRYPVESWKLPVKKDPESAMIFGRIEMPSDKKENPDGKVLLLNDVNFNLKGKVYVYMGHVPRGEKNFVMTNKYFVVPNIKPGKYHFAGFTTGNVYNSLPRGDDKLIDVKPGQLLYIGSYDYLDGTLSGLRMAFGIPGSYSLRPNKSPSELEMLQWLERAGEGSGWETAISQRIRQLGGRPAPRVSPVATKKPAG